VGKYADFAVCEKGTFRVLALIELDDRTHDTREAKERDRERDAMTAAAGFPTIRFDSRKKPDEATIAHVFNVTRPA
jgi:very-short-patch-repair endonuclease